MPRVHFVNEVVDVEVPAGTPLLEAAARAGVNPFRGLWQSVRCRGAGPARLLPYGACRRCRVWVRREGEPASSPRLACLEVVDADLRVTTRPGWELTAPGGRSETSGSP